MRKARWGQLPSAADWPAPPRATYAQSPPTAIDGQPPSIAFDDQLPPSATDSQPPSRASDGPPLPSVISVDPSALTPMRKARWGQLPSAADWPAPPRATYEQSPPSAIDGQPPSIAFDGQLPPSATDSQPPSRASDGPPLPSAAKCQSPPIAIELVEHTFPYDMASPSTTNSGSVQRLGTAGVAVPLAIEDIDLSSDSESDGFDQAGATDVNPDEFGIRTVRVFDPQRQGSATFYLVESKRSLSNGGIRHDCARRRFSDFVWLRGELQKLFPGCVIPPLPSKSVLSSIKAEFAEKRQRGLNIYMERVIKHPRLKSSPALDMLLAGTDEDLEKAKQGQTISAAALSSSFSVINFFNQTFQSVHESLMGSGTQLEDSDDDVMFKSMIEFVGNSLKSANSCLTAYQALISAQKETSRCWGNFGPSLGGFAADEIKENRQGRSGEFLNEVGLSADRVSVLKTHNLDQGCASFEEPLKDLIQQLYSVEEALQARCHAINTNKRATIDLDTKRAKLEALKSKEKVDREKIAEASADVSRCEQMKTNMDLFVDQVTESAIKDIAQFQHDKQMTIQRMVLAFVKIQVTSSEKMLSSWKAVEKAITVQP